MLGFKEFLLEADASGEDEFVKPKKKKKKKSFLPKIPKIGVGGKATAKAGKLIYAPQGKI